MSSESISPGTADIRDVCVPGGTGASSRETSSSIVTYDEENDHLCWKCQAPLTQLTCNGITYISEHDQNGLRSIRILEAPGSPETSARAGCPLCRRFVEYLSSSDRHWLQTAEEEQYRTRYEFRGFSDRFMHASLRITTFLPDPQIDSFEEHPSVTSCVESIPALGEIKMNWRS